MTSRPPVAFRSPSQPLLPTTTRSRSRSAVGSLSKTSRPSTGARRTSVAGLSGVTAAKAQRSSKTTGKHVVLPSAPQTKPLRAYGQGGSDEDVLGYETDAGVRVTAPKSAAERMSKDERRRAGARRITAYCVAESLRMKHLAGWLKREHNVSPRVFDEAMYVMYHLPLLPGYSSANVRSSAPQKVTRALMTRLSEAEENGYQGSYFAPAPEEGAYTADDGYMTSGSPETHRDRRLPPQHMPESESDAERFYESEQDAHHPHDGAQDSETDAEAEADRLVDEARRLIESESEFEREPDTELETDAEHETDRLLSDAESERTQVLPRPPIPLSSSPQSAPAAELRVTADDVELVPRTLSPTSTRTEPALPVAADHAAREVHFRDTPPVALEERHREKEVKALEAAKAKAGAYVHDPANVAEAVFFAYGVVVLFGFDEAQEHAVLEDITGAGALRRAIKEDDWEIEECHYAYDSEIAYPRIYNDFFTFKSPSHLLTLSVAHAIAQSTLLAHYESELTSVLSAPQTVSIPRQLASSGSLKLSRADALKLTGRLFKLRRDVNLVSNVLDVPELFWAEASMRGLYESVREYMEVGERGAVVNERLGVASDFLDAIHDHLNNNAMERITWIVIWLIVAAILVELGEVIARLVVHATGGSNKAGAMKMLMRSLSSPSS
ncbi:DUF155-domain-containing protein [Coniophora puteana RWD-64-598 SS2]|uniref:DUF155-domain-containing protein n=1 Tax=Coniophora puteana (strain RWD-64-598) TaxID=741705 RepID=A0A5M3MGY0_CONPW|nr:DUF155-domain-containing protein [Coniophora puteana RWD-64-598 SS2]EIW78317.1 DUF155-domain-containing protein [Coniophora puteana RWD-64-598 SS2]